MQGVKEEAMVAVLGEGAGEEFTLSCVVGKHHVNKCGQRKTVPVLASLLVGTRVGFSLDPWSSQREPLV